MRGVVVALAALVVLAGAPVVAGNQSPLADAGLDQRVERGETVLVDAMGSDDPDGSIGRYAWRIEAPDGTAVPPRCSDCAWTRFTPTQIGTYTVTLTVTDDDGASRTDHLYVTVRPASRPAGGAGATGPAMAPSAPSSAATGGPSAGAPGGQAGPAAAQTGGGEPVSPPSVELNPTRRTTWLGTPEDTGPPEFLDITTYPTISPFGGDMGGTTYYRHANGETESSTGAVLEVVVETD